jgi:hypothetical protein
VTRVITGTPPDVPHVNVTVRPDAESVIVDVGVPHVNVVVYWSGFFTDCGRALAPAAGSPNVMTVPSLSVNVHVDADFTNVELTHGPAAYG